MAPLPSSSPTSIGRPPAQAVAPGPARARPPLLPGLRPQLLALLLPLLAGAALAPALCGRLPARALWLALPGLLLAGASRWSRPAEAALALALLLLPVLRAGQRTRPLGEERRAAEARALLWQETGRVRLSGGRLRLDGRAWQRLDEGWRALPGRLAAWQDAGAAGHPGLRLLADGEPPFWTSSASAGNPGEGSPRERDWRSGRLGRVDGRRLAAGLALPGPAREVPVLQRLGDRLQARLEAECGPSAPLLTALLLGRRGRLPRELADAFRATGLAHLLAVSGLHVALLAGAAALALGPLPLPARCKPPLLAGLLWCYAALTGLRPSVLRAAAMGSWLLGARAFGRPGGLGGALAWSAAAELAWRPEDLADAGFLLSYGAVGGLGLAMPAARALDGWLRRLPRRLASLGAPLRWMAAGLGATAAASLGTAAPLLAIFGRLPLGSAPLNLPALPLGAALLAAGWLQLLLPLPGAPFARAADGLALALAELAGRAAAAGPATLVWRPAPGQALLLAAALALPFVPRGRLRLRLALAGAAGLAAADLGPRLDRPRAVELLMLDVGQGDALLLRSPAGARWLVDAGWADPLGRGRDAGRDRVLPLLERLAPEGLDGLVLSHPDQDHLGGAASVLAGLPVDTVWWNGEWRANRSQDALRALLAAPGAPPLAQAPPGRTLAAEAGLRLRALGPPAPGFLPAGNERSVVLRVEAGPRTALLTADAGHPAEAWLLTGWGVALRSELLKLGHHGSAHSSSAAFLDGVAPSLAWISAGAGNRYGHPTPAVLEACAERGLPVQRTDLAGAAWLRAGRQGWEPVRRLPWCRPAGLRRGPLLVPPGPATHRPPPQPPDPSEETDE